MDSKRFLLDQDFSRGTLDPVLSDDNPNYEQRPDGRQYADPGDGKISFPIQLPFPQYASLEIRLEVTFKSAAEILLYTGQLSFMHGGSKHSGCCLLRGHNFGIQRPPEPVRYGRGQTFTFQVAEGKYALHVDGAPFMQFEDPNGPEAFLGIQLILRGDPLIHRIRIEATEALPAARHLTPRKPFQFNVTIDFPDDMIYAVPYGPAHFDSMLDHFQQWGIKRVYWMPYDRGLFEGFAACVSQRRPIYIKTVQKTLALMGDPLDYLVKHGHERGMEVYATLKPHEMGFSLPGVYPDGTKEARERGKVRFVDGWTPNLVDFLYKRPDFLVQRRPGSGPDDVRNRRIRTIKLWHWRDEPIGLPPDAIRIWVSRNNAGYSLYSGPRSIAERTETRRRLRYDHCGVHADGLEESVRVLTIDGLETDATFVVLTVPPGLGRCVNRYFALAELLDPSGRSIPMSYGLKANPLDWSTDRTPFDPADLTTASLRYDALTDCGAFSAMAPWDRAETLCAFGQYECLLGLAKGKTPCIAGAAEAAYPEVREWWLSIVRRLIAQGVDGVDFRAGSHGVTFEWSQFGFNPPVAAEYKRRYGVDILTQDFDAGPWHRLRGEFYAQFLREASAALRAAGRKCQVHIFDFDEADPDRDKCMMNMHWDWRKWIAEGFIDEISNKGMLPHGAFWRDICRAAESQGVPIYHIPFAGVISFGRKSWPATFERLFDAVRESGQSGLDLYECACLLCPAPGKDALQVVPEAKGFTEFMQQYNRRLGVK